MLAQFGRLLRAIASGPDPANIPAPSEIIPTIDLAKPPADWLYPQGIHIYAGFASESAGAGARSQVALSNPADSGTIAVIDRIEAKSDNNLVTIYMGVAEDVELFDSDGSEYTREPRVYRTLITPQPSRAPACKVLSEQSAAKGQATALMYPAYYDTADYYYKCTEPFILLPGTVVNVVPGSDQKTNVTTFFWREREFDQEEVRGTPFV